MNGSGKSPDNVNEKPSVSAYDFSNFMPFLPYMLEELNIPYTPGFTSTWTELKTHSYILNDTSTEAKDLALIIRMIGMSVDMDYGIDGSYASIGAAKRYLKNTGYHNVEKKKYDVGYVMDMLKNRKLPTYIRGQSSDGGHAWVIDGMMKQQRTTTRNTIRNGAIIESTTISTEERLLLHCNYGWGGGSANGYYLSKAFNTKAGPVAIDTTANDPNTKGNYNFTKDFKVIKYKK